jgi:DNA-directed RNA polymerase specialized sigma24 family protein
LVHQLPADAEHLIQLRLAGLTDREIATVLGKSHGAVRTAQHRAIQRLKALSTERFTTTGSRR